MPWYVQLALERGAEKPKTYSRGWVASSSRATRVCAVTGAAALLLTGCGGPARQDADEPTGRYRVEVTEASFPDKQKLAKSSRMKIAVRNVDAKTIPNIAVTVGTDVGGTAGSEDTEGFDYYDPGNEDASKPIFVIDTEPRGGSTAYRETWALGELGPGKTKTFVWDMTAVEARPYDIRYQVSAGLDGKAKAIAANGGQPGGRFRGKVSDAIPQPKVARSGEDIVDSGQTIEPRDPKN